MANYRDLDDPSAVRKAIAECDEIGREKFLTKYGYGKARTFMLICNEKQYDSKAIVGAAYQYQFSKYLKNTDFSGGLATVVPLLSNLGFTVVGNEINDQTTALAEEVPDTMWEGGRRTVYVNAYERNSKARTACIETHGSRCAICDFDFGETYGPEFQGFIHVHHRVPVSSVGARYKVNPEKDLVPLCPNCHAIVHYGNKTRSENDIRKKLKKTRGRKTEDVSDGDIDTIANTK